MVGMPHNPQSFLKWLNEYQPDRFDQLRYSDEDRRAIIKSLKKAVRLKEADAPPIEAFYPLLHQIEDIAAAYVALEKAFRSDKGLPSREFQRKQLKRLADATKLITFRKAVLALHPSLWLSIAMRIDTLDSEDWRKLFGSPEVDPNISLAHAEAIREGAHRTLEDFQGRRSKPGPKKHMLIVWFARQLIPLYERTTANRATAYHTAHSAGPFARFVTACVRPLDPDVVEDGLNEALYNQIFKAKR